MKKTIFALIIMAVLAFGCLGGGAAPSVSPTAEPTRSAAIVTVDPALEKAVSDNSDQMAQIDQMSKDLEETDIAITDEELDALG